MSSLNPRLQPGQFIFASVSQSDLPDLDPIGIFHEKEGISVILTLERAMEKNLDCNQIWKWIALDLETSLTTVGITAVISRNLANANIPCNVVAAYHHDHIFVPDAQASKALEVLDQITI